MLIDVNSVKQMFTKEKIYILISFAIFVLFRGLAYLFEFGDLSIYYVVDQFKTFFSIVIVLYYTKNQSIFEIPKWFSSAFLILVAIVCVRTSITLLIYPNLSRMMATGVYESEINTFLVASYDTIYGLVFLDLYFVYSLVSIKYMNKKEKIVFISMLVLITFTILLASFTLALFLLLIGCFFMLPFV
jgi:hypothetical protein